MKSLMLHEDMTKKQAKERAIEMLKMVKIPLAEKRFHEIPISFPEVCVRGL